MHVPEKKIKWLVFPIENFVREYYGKFLLSAVAAERGWGAIMAYKGYIRHNLPAVNGVVVEMNMTSAERVNRYLGLGWRVCAWDEEGLIYNNGDVYAHRRLNEEAIRKIDSVFLWGENQRNDILNHVKGIENKLYQTGNPRFDLLRPDLREFYAPAAALLKNSHGRYILVNTTFGDVNHYFGRDYNIKILRKAGKLTTEEQELDQIAREKYKELLFRAFIEMLPALSAHFPEHKIIIRPHPAENFDTWRSAAEDLPNVIMIHEGDPIPWMLGAEAVIHNSCTTGVQAYLLGRPVIAYRPVTSDKYDMYLPNALSHQTQDIDQLITLVRELTSNPGSIDQKSEQEKRLVTRKYIESMEGAWASDRIMDELEKLDVSPQALDPEAFSALNQNDSQPTGKRKMLTNLMMRLKNRLFRDNPNTPHLPEKTWDNYTRQRFPTLSNDIQFDLKRLQDITGRFSNVSIYHAGNDLVCVYPPEN
jgi:surface carbohydrate biosynthesis protein